MSAQPYLFHHHVCCKSLKDHCIPPQPPNASGHNLVKIQMDSGWSVGSRLGNWQVGAAESPGHFLTDTVTSEKNLVHIESISGG